MWLESVEGPPESRLKNLTQEWRGVVCMNAPLSWQLQLRPENHNAGISLFKTVSALNANVASYSANVTALNSEMQTL